MQEPALTADALSSKALHQLLEPRMVTQRGQVRIILYPLSVAETLTEGLFQTVDCLVCLINKRKVQATL